MEMEQLLKQKRKCTFNYMWIKKWGGCIMHGPISK